MCRWTLDVALGRRWHLTRPLLEWAAEASEQSNCADCASKYRQTPLRDKRARAAWDAGMAASVAVSSLAAAASWVMVSLLPAPMTCLLLQSSPTLCKISSSEQIHVNGTSAARLLPAEHLPRVRVRR